MAAPNARILRNDPCPCGSGKKYKRCCGAGDLSALFQQAVQYCNGQEFHEAEVLLRQVVDTIPHFADAIHLLAVALARQRRLAEAIPYFQQRAEMDPRETAVFTNLGKVLYQVGRIDDAEQSFQRALAIDPDDLHALRELSDLYNTAGRPADAESIYRRLMRLTPDDPMLHNNLGNALRLQRKLDDALACFQQALCLDPRFASAFNNLGNVYNTLQRGEEAVAAYQRAVELDPKCVTAANNLGTLLHTQGRFAEAVDVFYQAASADPGGSAAQMTKIGLMLPPILAASAEIAAQRQRLDQAVQRLTAMNVRLSDPAAEINLTQFYLAYHGLNDRALQQQIADFYLQACPALGWTAPHCVSGAAGGAKRRLRLGIASGYLHHHTIGKFTIGLLEQLSREEFDTVLLTFSNKQDDYSARFAAAAGKVIALPEKLAAAREIIAREELDILLYPDIGMYPLTYFLAFSRLAPVQCVTWGHPVTTGIPAMDYFLSARELEPEDADAHYSEQLIRLVHLPTYYYRPALTGAARDRADFGLPEDAHLYLCPQSLFKFHPDFDLALAALLRRDPHGVLALISGAQPQWTHLLHERFWRQIPDVADRILYLPQVGLADYLQLLTLADVVIDPPYFGGGNTSYETLALGIPIVTWPGPFMRGRVTSACYRLMGMDELIAGDAGAYVELACRVANDRAWRAALQAKILERSSVLFEDTRRGEGIGALFPASRMRRRARRKNYRMGESRWPQLISLRNSPCARRPARPAVFP